MLCSICILPYDFFGNQTAASLCWRCAPAASLASSSLHGFGDSTISYWRSSPLPIVRLASGFMSTHGFRRPLRRIRCYRSLGSTFVLSSMSYGSHTQTCKCVGVWWWSMSMRPQDHTLDWLTVTILLPGAMCWWAYDCRLVLLFYDYHMVVTYLILLCQYGFSLAFSY